MLLKLLLSNVAWALRIICGFHIICMSILIRSAYIDTLHACAPTRYNGKQYRRSEKTPIVLSRYQILVKSAHKECLGKRTYVMYVSPIGGEMYIRQLESRHLCIPTRTRMSRVSFKTPNNRFAECNNVSWCHNCLLIL